MYVLLSSVALIVALHAAGTNGFCPLGSVKSAIDTSICYKFVSAKSPFLDAEEACRQHRGHLASVTSGFANAFINDEALRSFGNESDGYFIGANRLAAVGRWVWTDGSKFAYAHGALGEPVRHPGLDCLYVATEDGLWHAGNCFTQRPFVCIVPQSNATECPPVPTCPAFTAPPPLTTPPTTLSPTTRRLTPQTSTPKAVPTTTVGALCESGWQRYVSKSGVFCYRVVVAVDSLLDAITTCVGRHATVVSIHDEEENEFVRRWVFGHYRGQMWLGLHRTSDYSRQQSGSLEKYDWIDGSPFDYSAWAADDVSRGDATSCIVMQEKGQWYHIECEATAAYAVCKKPAHG